MKAGKPGTVYLVGAGPGDPGLLTRRGLELLKEADVVVYDRLAAPEMLLHATRSAERIYVGKAPGQHALSQERINALLNNWRSKVNGAVIAELSVVLQSSKGGSSRK